MTTGGVMAQHPLSFCMIVDYMRHSLGLDSCPIELDYISAEFRDFFIRPVGFHHSNDIALYYNAYIKRFNGFIINLDQRKFSANEKNGLERLLQFLQVDDEFYFGDVQKAKGGKQRPVLFVYLMKNKKKGLQIEKLTKQVEELIENTNFEPNLFHITFIYDGDQWDEKESQNAHFYSAMEWYYLKLTNKS